MRPGLDPDDVLLSLAGLWEIDPKSDWRGRARRLFDLVFGGLGPDGTRQHLLAPPPCRRPGVPVCQGRFSAGESEPKHALGT